MITAIRFNGVGISAFGSILTGGCSAFPRSAVGFVHLLQRKLEQKGLSLGPKRRVAVGIENYRLHKGEKNPSTPKMSLSKPWNGKSAIAHSVLDYELKCNATLTLIITSDGIMDVDGLLIALKSLIPSMRFSNGSIFVSDRFVELVPGNDHEALTTAIKAVRASQTQFVISRDDLLKKDNEFSSFADALALFDESELNGAVIDNEPEQTDDDDDTVTSQKRKWHRKKPGWIVPLERGYQAVTPPVVGRPAARHPDIPSIVVTPVIGLGQFVTAKHFLDHLDCKSFWHSWSNREAGFYLFNASSFNH